jgi:hypothetical protein
VLVWSPTQILSLAMVTSRIGNRRRRIRLLRSLYRHLSKEDSIILQEAVTRAFEIIREGVHQAAYEAFSHLFDVSTDGEVVQRRRTRPFHFTRSRHSSPVVDHARSPAIGSQRSVFRATVGFQRSPRTTRRQWSLPPRTRTVRRQRSPTATVGDQRAVSSEATVGDQRSFETPSARDQLMVPTEPTVGFQRAVLSEATVGDQRALAAGYPVPAAPFAEAIEREHASMRNLDTRPLLGDMLAWEQSYSELWGPQASGRELFGTKSGRKSISICASCSVSSGTLGRELGPVPRDVFGREIYPVDVAWKDIASSSDVVAANHSFMSYRTAPRRPTARDRSRRTLRLYDTRHDYNVCELMNFVLENVCGPTRTRLAKQHPLYKRLFGAVCEVGYRTVLSIFSPAKSATVGGVLPAVGRPLSELSITTPTSARDSPPVAGDLPAVGRPLITLTTGRPSTATRRPVAGGTPAVGRPSTATVGGVSRIKKAMRKAGRRFCEAILPLVLDFQKYVHRYTDQECPITAAWFNPRGYAYRGEPGIEAGLRFITRLLAHPIVELYFVVAFLLDMLLVVYGFKSLMHAIISTPTFMNLGLGTDSTRSEYDYHVDLRHYNPIPFTRAKRRQTYIRVTGERYTEDHACELCLGSGEE